MIECHSIPPCGAAALDCVQLAAAFGYAACCGVKAMNEPARVYRCDFFNSRQQAAMTQSGSKLHAFQGASHA